MLNGTKETAANSFADSEVLSALVEQALRMALTQRQPAPGTLLHHSDRGSQDASTCYQQLLAAHGTIASTSRVATRTTMRWWKAASAR